MRLFLRAVLILFCLFLSTVSEGGDYNASDSLPTSFRVVGYFRGDVSEVDQYDYNKMTHLIYCFMYLQGNKIGFKNEDSRNTLKQCLALKKKYPHLKVLIGFGGWGGCETCSDVFSTDTARKEFALSVKNILQEFNADGIDIDWESPVIGGYKNHKSSVDDKDNFTALIRALRVTLPAEKEICFDANSFKEYIDVSVDWPEVMALVDFVNLMTYGLPADKRGHTGHHSALYSSPCQQESIHKAINYLDSMQVPLEKIVIGAAFYAFVVEQVDSVNHGLARPGKFHSNRTYRQVMTDFTVQNGYTLYRDNMAAAPYLYNPEQRKFVTIDDKESVALKTRYAINRRLGGIMFWKLNGDTFSDGLLDAIDGEIRRGVK